MNGGEIAQKILFRWEDLSREELVALIAQLSFKWRRYLATNHPDNRTRKLLLRNSHVHIGTGAIINSGIVISDDYKQLCFIGERVAIASGLTVVCDSNPNKSVLAHNAWVKERLIYSKKVVIENDCWIGANVTILGGVTVGQSSIIGAGSVVVSDVEPHGIYAGVPARKIRSIEGV